MPTDHDRAYLQDIAEACRLIQRIVGGIDLDAFRANVEKHWAVVSQLLLIGEAVKHLSATATATAPHIPWSDIARMRDKMIHHYRDIDLAEVWHTATRSIDALGIAVEALQAGAEDEERR